MMGYRLPNVFGCLVGIVLLSAPADAVSIANCYATTSTVCEIPENQALELPFEAKAGDVVLTLPNSTTVADVFRISNNIINTGGGTGLGDLAFLYSADDNILPAPATYSSNVVFITEDPSGITSYVGNGTTYLLGAPEPKALALLGFAGLGMILMRRRWNVPREGL